jgi:hypothetical protein
VLFSNSILRPGDSLATLLPFFRYRPAHPYPHHRQTHRRIFSLESVKDKVGTIQWTRATSLRLAFGTCGAGHGSGKQSSRRLPSTSATTSPKSPLAALDPTAGGLLRPGPRLPRLERQQPILRLSSNSNLMSTIQVFAHSPTQLRPSTALRVPCSLRYFGSHSDTTAAHWTLRS